MPTSLFASIRNRQKKKKSKTFFSVFVLRVYRKRGRQRLNICIQIIWTKKIQLKLNEHPEEKRFYDVRLGFVSVPATPCTVGY